MTRSSPPLPRESRRFTLDELAAEVGGSVEGAGGTALTGIAAIGDAGAGDITFCDGERHLAALEASEAGAVIVDRTLAVEGRNLLRVDSPALAFARLLALFHPPEVPPPGVHPSAVCDPGARIDPAAAVGAFCWIGPGAAIGAGAVVHPGCYVGAGAVVGEESLLHPHVTVREGVRLGARVIVHSGSVIGSDGFGYVFDGESHRKIPQVGTVEVGDDVEVGAGVTVDRATVGTTRIGPGTKIDNLVQVGHNVEIGARAIIVSQVGLAGSVRVGDGAVLGGQVGVADHIDIGAGARLAAQSGILRDVPAGETMGGLGPVPHREFLRAYASLYKLHELRRTVQELNRKIARLEERLAEKDDGPDAG